MAKIGRNDRCLCGSGLKYKKCCLDKIKSKFIPNIPPDLKRIIELQKANEKIRQQQQGLGKPIISEKYQGHQVVAIGNRVYLSKNWKTFPDFLHHLMAEVFGRQWFADQKKLPEKERHPVSIWSEKVFELGQTNKSVEGEVFSMPFTGAVYCYLGIAYSLYLLNHNVELQDLLIKRLKDINNFQGAYYEVMIANCLIRAGFKLHLEDETDEESKHCEFYAVSKSGKRYSVEAKMRSVRDVLGKTEKNGTKAGNPTSKLTDHINLALQKPSDSERLIFVDINSPEKSENAIGWIEKAAEKLERKEKDSPDKQAYIFVTNMNFHWNLDLEENHRVIFAHGLGIPDFARPGYIRLIDAYKRKQKYKDAYEICESFQDYPKVPSTFDGSLSSETFSANPQPIKIGETYNFDSIGIAKVTTAAVMEQEKKIYIGTDTGKIITMPMSDAELEDYKLHKELYFGQPERSSFHPKNAFEFFENMVEMHSTYTKDQIIKQVSSFPDYENLKGLSREEMVFVMCERLTMNAWPDQVKPLHGAKLK